MEMNALIAFLDAVPEGQLILLAACDDVGLNVGFSCDNLAHTWVEAGMQALEALGSTMIRDYCFRNSWAMAAIKGQGVAIDEALGSGVQVSAQAVVNLP